MLCGSFDGCAEVHNRDQDLGRAESIYYYVVVQKLQQTLGLGRRRAFYQMASMCKLNVCKKPGFVPRN